ncbi:MAG: ABC transporter substrate-binding protein [Legionellales bacterium]
MYKILLILLGWLSIPILHASAPTLTVGTNAEFPPFTYIENKTIVGFDIDIAKEVARRLGKEIQFKDMPFDALIPETILGRVDFVAAGMSYTEERAKRVLFTKPYLSEDPLVIFTKAEKKLDLEDLKGKTVVVIEGFTADLFMSSKPGIHLIRLPTQADGFMAVKSNRADAFVTAKSTVDTFFAAQDSSLFHISELEGTGETCALVVPKNKPAILVEVQRALEEMENDGTLANLKTKWNIR